VPRAPSKPLSDRLFDRLKNKRVAAYLIIGATVLGGIASSAESLSKIYSLMRASVRDGAIPVVLPKDTGWILVGYFDSTIAKYTQGPYVKVVRSPYPVGFHKEGTLAFQNLSPLSCPLA
jgi:hypothetical protein